MAVILSSWSSLKFSQKLICVKCYLFAKDQKINMHRASILIIAIYSLFLWKKRVFWSSKGKLNAVVLNTNHELCYRIQCYVFNNIANDLVIVHVMLWQIGKKVSFHLSFLRLYENKCVLFEFFITVFCCCLFCIPMLNLIKHKTSAKYIHNCGN